MIRIYGCCNTSHRSMIKRFVESAGTKLPTDLRIVVDYHKRRSGIIELIGWRVYRKGSQSLLCQAKPTLNDVSWFKRGLYQKSDYLSDYVGVYSVEECLQYPEEKEVE